MSKVTAIKELPLEDVKKDDIIIDTDRDSMSDMIMDLSVSLATRIKAVDLFYKDFGQEESNELINKLSTMYQFSGTKSLEEYLYEICTKSTISSILKITASKSLCIFNPKQTLGYKALDYVCKNMEEVPTPCKIEAVCVLMKSKTHKKQSLEYFSIIINNVDIECDFRYKTILSLENKDINDKIWFIKYSAMDFFYNNKNRTLYRILAGQLLIQKCSLEQDEQNKIELTLMSFAQDPDLDYNLRADAADAILHLGSDDNKITARKLIMMLGRQGGDVKTIFDNAQNVHIDEIEESVLEGLEFLASIPLGTVSKKPDSDKIDFEYVKKQITDMIDVKDDVEQSKDEKDKCDKIHISLNRIYMDRALYGIYNCSLSHILLKVWTYLKSHSSEDVMKQRLLEELIEMSGTCSSGFAGRLVNVISGFGEFNLRISWRDQIIANFTGRLNARARDITDNNQFEQNSMLYINHSKESSEKKTKEEIVDELEEFQGYVLEEMTINSNDFQSRKNFLKFFRKNMLSIRQELYQEFKEHITDTDFDLYFRSAISSYETGGYV